MGHKLTLEISDDIYEPLNRNAEQTGRSPEVVAIEWLKTAAETLTEDPLLQLAGVFAANVTDMSERHDHYIGDQLLMDLRDTESE